MEELDWNGRLEIHIKVEEYTIHFRHDVRYTKYNIE